MHICYGDFIYISNPVVHRAPLKSFDAKRRGSVQGQLILLGLRDVWHLHARAQVMESGNKALPRQKYKAASNSPGFVFLVWRVSHLMDNRG